MAVLEPVEVDKRSADRALALCNDKSLFKFDQLLRVQQVKQGTRSTYYWQLLRLNIIYPNQRLSLRKYLKATF